MTEGEKTRLVAWGREMRAVHDRLRAAVQLVRESTQTGTHAGSSTRDLLLFCHGFCTALDGHHRGEDRTLFPAIAARHPDLGDTLRRLEQDHSMISHLLGGLQRAVDEHATPDTLGRHLDGIEAVMESHFRYEERQLLPVLDALQLDEEVRDVLGPL